MTQKARTVRVSEIFYSIEGEGPFTGIPTVFVRFFGCNFTCSGFSNPDNTPVVLTGTLDLKKFKPAAGCDSAYAWHPAYKHTTEDYTVGELAAQIFNVLRPYREAVVGLRDRRARGRSLVGIRHPVAHTSPVLSLTGGEPTLHQDIIAELLEMPAMADFDKVLIETNASVPLREDFLRRLSAWEAALPEEERVVVWSNSPKLSASGEPYAKAIRPEVLIAQRRAGGIQYLKFVTDGSTDSIDEINRVLEVYDGAFEDANMDPIDRHSVYLMPVGSSLEQQEEAQLAVADACLRHGYSFCARVHCWVFGNAVGT